MAGERHELGMFGVREPDPTQLRRNFQLETYLAAMATQFPSLPDSYSWRRPGFAYGQLGNQRHGDCVAALVGHIEQTWSYWAGDPSTPTEEQTLDMFCRECGYDRSIGDPSDHGCIVGFVLSGWRRNGIAVGTDPTSYTVTVVNGIQPLVGENVLSEFNRPRRARIVARDELGRIIPTPDDAVFQFTYVNGLTNQVSGDSAILTPTSDAQVAEVMTVMAGGLSWHDTIFVSKPIGYLASFAAGKIGVRNQLIPFIVGENVIGSLSGSKMRIDAVTPPPSFKKLLASMQIVTPYNNMALVDQAWRQLRYSIFIFQCAATAIALPATIHSQGDTWTVVDPTLQGDSKPASGGRHAVDVLGFDNDPTAQGGGWVYFITWGQYWKMSKQFFMTYATEAYACMSYDMLNRASYLTSNGFDLPALLGDLNGLKAA